MIITYTIKRLRERNRYQNDNNDMREETMKVSSSPMPGWPNFTNWTSYVQLAHFLLDITHSSVLMLLHSAL
jgi:hypothetical protein